MFPLPRPIENGEDFVRRRDVVDLFSFSRHVRLRLLFRVGLRQVFLIIDKGLKAASAQRIVPLPF